MLFPLALVLRVRQSLRAPYAELSGALDFTMSAIRCICHRFGSSLGSVPWLTGFLVQRTLTPKTGLLTPCYSGLLGFFVEAVLQLNPTRLSTTNSATMYWNHDNPELEMSAQSATLAQTAQAHGFHNEPQYSEGIGLGSTAPF